MPPHTGFIVAAFLVTGLVLGGTAAAILLDYRAQLRALARLSGEPSGRPSSRNAQEARR
jgi:heme exporter protein CcmD